MTAYALRAPGEKGIHFRAWGSLLGQLLLRSVDRAQLVYESMLLRASVTPTVIKSSAGAAERLPVARVANIGETIRRLKEQGVFVYCADMDGVSLRRNNLTGPIALVLGSEGSGVSQLVKKLCDGVVRLDMAAPGTGVDSYNVSVAAGIILYEIQSQRTAQQA